jgi:hypothetical protein
MDNIDITSPELEASVQQAEPTSRSVSELVQEAFNEIKGDVDDSDEETKGDTVVASSDEEDQDAPEADKDKSKKKEGKQQKKAEVEKAFELEQLKKDYGELDVATPPRHWKKAAKEMWENIPDRAKFEVKRYIEAQESFIDNQTKSFKKYEKSINDWDSVRDQVKPFAKQMNVKESDYIQNLIKADAVAHEDPVTFLSNFARSYNIDLVELVNGGVPFDTVLHKERVAKTKMEAELDALKQQMRYIEESTQATRQKQLETQSVTFVQNFLDTKPAEEVNMVVDTLPSFIEQVKAAGVTDARDILSEAYDRALQYSHKNFERYRQITDAQKKEEIRRRESARGIKSTTSAANNYDEPRSYNNVQDVVLDALEQLRKKRSY